MLSKLTLTTSGFLAESEALFTSIFLYFGLGFAISAIVISLIYVSDTLRKRYRLEDGSEKGLAKWLSLAFGIVCFVALMAPASLIGLMQRSEICTSLAAPIALAVGVFAHPAIHYILNKQVFGK